MLKPSMLDLLNGHINRELYSSYLYLAMSAWCEDFGLKGFAHWVRIQAQEELAHSMKFFDYIHDRQGRAVLTAVQAPPSEWDSPLAVAEAILAHENTVSDAIDQLMDEAVKVSDHPTQAMLRWFVSEQVEEVATAADLVDKFRLVGKDGQGMLFVDMELSKRVFVPPPANGNAAGPGG